jgi:hypothetical protein
MWTMIEIRRLFRVEKHLRKSKIICLSLIKMFSYQLRAKELRDDNYTANQFQVSMGFVVKLYVCCLKSRNLEKYRQT